MAQNATFDLPARTWVLLTNSDVTAARISLISARGVLLQATVGATAPTNFEGAVPLSKEQTIPASVTLADLWPGVSGANRIYAYAFESGEVSISHA